MEGLAVLPLTAAPQPYSASPSTEMIPPAQSLVKHDNPVLVSRAGGKKVRIRGLGRMEGKGSSRLALLAPPVGA